MLHLFPSRTVALSIGPFAIHWYGVMYALAFVIGILLIPRLSKYRRLSLSAKQLDALYTSIILGVLIGGRLGYVLLYAPLYYLTHPIAVFAIWEGGMASHGGFIGVALALILFTRRNNVSVLALADVLMVPVAIGLAFGRVGNFINGELYGTVTTVPWAMHFPGAQGLRHPVQLYSVAKNLFIAGMCFLHLRSTQDRPSLYGVTVGIFLVLYGIMRMFIENFRDQPFGYVSLGLLRLSWGQTYTLPVIAAGIVVLLYIAILRRRTKHLHT